MLSGQAYPQGRTCWPPQTQLGRHADTLKSVSLAWLLGPSGPDMLRAESSPGFVRSDCLITYGSPRALKVDDIIFKPKKKEHLSPHPGPAAPHAWGGGHPSALLVGRASAAIAAMSLRPRHGVWRPSLLRVKARA